MMKLIEPRDKGSEFHETLDQPLVLTIHGAPVAAYLKKGQAGNLAEAVLLTELARAPSDAVKLTLAMVLAAFRACVGRIVGNAVRPTNPNHEGCRAACRGPGAQLWHKGRLWLAIGISAGVLHGHATLPTRMNSVHRVEGTEAGVFWPQVTELQDSFRHIMDDMAPSTRKWPLPDKLTDEEVTAVEIAITRAWLHNLSLIDASTAATGAAIDVSTGIKIRYIPAQSWDRELVPRPDAGFAIHFGLSKKCTRHTTDTLALVSDNAVLAVLESLFPDNPPGMIPEYLRLLRDGY